MVEPFEHILLYSFVVLFVYIYIYIFIHIVCNYDKQHFVDISRVERIPSIIDEFQACPQRINLFRALLCAPLPLTALLFSRVASESDKAEKEP